jgi:hypothetical protein
MREEHEFASGLSKCSNVFRCKNNDGIKHIPILLDGTYISTQFSETVQRKLII